MTAQVLVIGAGPVGLTMAAELARYGVSVRIIDKAAARSDKSKALVLWSRTLELLERAGCSEDFVAAGLRATGITFIAGRRRLAHVPFGIIPSRYAYGLMLPQADTERLLDTHLQSLGVQVERQVELTNFADDGAGITATLRHADGQEETVRTDWLIGCDGAHSTVRHQLGLEFVGETLATDWLLADLHLRGLPTPPDELALFLHKDGILAVFPITPGRYRIIADVGRSHGALRTDPTLADVQAVVDQRGPGGIEVSDPVWLSAFRINERKVQNYRAGRVFLAGDAAHVHSPAGGQGMNTGMQDAFNLAWKLALVAHGTCAAEPLLGSYSAERSAVGAQVLADAGQLTAVAMVKNPLAQAARNLAASLALRLPFVQANLTAKLSETAIAYPNSPLNGPRFASGGPKAGARLPPTAGQPPIGAGSRPRFALFAAPTDATTQLTRLAPDLLEPALRPPLAPNAIHLARPDGYVALRTGGQDIDGVQHYLDALRTIKKGKQFFL